MPIRRSRRTGPRGLSGPPMNMGRVAALEAKFATGKATATISAGLALNATFVVTVTLDKSMSSADAYTAVGTLTKSSAAYGVLRVQETNPVTANTVNVVLIAAILLLSSITVTVNVAATSV